MGRLVFYIVQYIENWIGWFFHRVGYRKLHRFFRRVVYWGGGLDRLALPSFGILRIG